MILACVLAVVAALIAVSTVVARRPLREVDRAMTRSGAVAKALFAATNAESPAPQPVGVTSQDAGLGVS